MSARILVVDDIPTNALLLEARLTAEYFEVVTARNGPEALTIIDESQPDIVLLDVMMPGMDGFEVCRRIKSNPLTMHIPVIMVTALDQSEDRIKGLEAGADDFLTKPVNDIALLARVKSLVRLKTVTDELRLRSVTGEEMGILDESSWDSSISAIPGRILLVEDNMTDARLVTAALSPPHEVIQEESPVEAIMKAAEVSFDLIIVSLNLQAFDGLRLCSQLKSLERTRQIPILIIVEPGEDARLVRGLDLGVNDYIMRPIDDNELFARARTQFRRKRYTDQLRKALQDTIERAVRDGLTGLHNRRYMETHMNTLFESAINRGKDLSVLMMDIDFFKAVNDTHGHDAGDKVLVEFARRAEKGIRSNDLLCRYGGEEFVLIMPETGKDVAFQIADRMRAAIADKPFDIDGGKTLLDVTMSVGVGSIEHPQDRPEDIMKRADQALYQAKREGRNRVIANAA
ncbi:MAG TPA: PleD family two-component system response regulator [Rhizobiales bacterium]|nr:PleD family two-component system response regulator [Hyphomicrobiales bacterium]